MKKIILGAAVSAAMFSAAANASGPAIDPSTYIIHLSGSSAASKFIDQLITNATVPATSQLCDTTAPIYKFTNGSNYTAYYCKKSSTNTVMKALTANSYLLIHKRNAGGSGQGVTPVINSTAIDFLNVNRSDCATGSASAGITPVTCGFTAGEYTHVPDFGVSDVDPVQFTGANNPAYVGTTASASSDVTQTQVNTLKVTPAAAQLFGVVASLKLRNALQYVQFTTGNVCNPTNANYSTLVTGQTYTNAESAACQPSISTAQATSIFLGEFASWDQLEVTAGKGLYTTIANAAVSAALPGSARVHICSRTPGSGTTASFGIKFLNYPCGGAYSLPAAQTTDTTAGVPAYAGTTLSSVFAPETTFAAQVHQMASGGNLEDCLDSLDKAVNGTNVAASTLTGGRWAIGVQGTDSNAALGKNYRFLKVDGNAPTLANAVNGKYKWWTELTFQYKTTLSGDTLKIANEFIKQAGNPAVMAVTNAATNTATHTWGNAGYLAVPQNWAPPASGILNVASPVNTLSHGTLTKNTNNCRAPSFYKASTAASLNAISLF